MLPENYEKMEYKDLMKAHELRDGDVVHNVGYDTVLMCSLYADYDEFPKARSMDRLESYAPTNPTSRIKERFEPTSCASTGEQYTVLDDGTEWYVSILGTKYDNGWSLYFTKRQVPFEDTIEGRKRAENK